jgi:acetylornithine deacetylase/succinyl-diaminopimelate desuccinylase-like protein
MPERTERVVDTLLELLSRPSASNQDRSNIVGFVQDWLSSLGMSVTLHGSENLPALCATNGSGGIILSGHLDTVPVGSNWERGQGEIVGGRIYGRGTADMKGGVAAMLHTAVDLMRDDLPFSIFLTTDEEDRMTGAYALAELDPVKEAKGILVGEPTDLLPAYKEKGISRFRLTTYGLAAHASQPWLGENAIQKMSGLLERLNRWAKAPVAPTEDMTLCISMIKGGLKPNIVPDRCEVDIDARFPKPLTYQKVRTIIMDELKGSDYDIHMLYELEAYEADVDSELSRAAREVTGTELTIVPYATEAPIFAAYNPNVLVCGPGAMTMAHADDEFVERWQLERAIGIYIAMARRMAQG